MEQQQIRVSFSVGTKLLIGVVSLLILVISFLDISTILLLTEDKRAYTYQGQAAEASMVGKDFQGVTRYSQNTLRLALVTPQEAALKLSLEGQNDLISIAIYELDSTTQTLSKKIQSVKESEITQLKLSAQDLEASEEEFKSAYAELEQTGIAYLNLSTPGKMPLLGLAVLDRGTPSLTSNPANPSIDAASKKTVAIGVLPLSSYSNDVYSSKITLATKRGKVLFDSDPATLYGQISIKTDPLFIAAIESKATLGAKEFDFQDVRYLGSYFRPNLELIVLTRTEWRKAMRATYALSEKFILLGLMSVGAAILFAILFSKTLTAPISRLYQATRAVAAGNFHVELNTKGRDELAALSSSFVAMSERIDGLIKESIRNAHLESELAIASTVQQTLFPPTSYQSSKIEIQSLYKSATECGGDWWGFFEVGNKMAILIADATGHGLPSALITASARSCFSVIHKLMVEHPEVVMSPGMMLSYANRVVHESANGQIMMTFFASVIDFDAKNITYASAGHNPPWLFKNQGSKFTTTSLTANGQRLGEANEVPPYEEKTLELSKGDTLVLYTDGILEGKDLAGTQFGKKKTRKLLDEKINEGPGSMIQNLMAQFETHNTGKPFDDDVTLAVAKIL